MKGKRKKEMRQPKKQQHAKYGRWLTFGAVEEHGLTSESIDR
jgi:hypothetical protein